MKRFKNILDTSDRKSGYVLAALLLCTVVLLCGLVGCTEKKEEVIQSESLGAVVSYSDAFDSSDGYNIFDSSDGYMDAERAMELINEYRVSNGLNELNVGDEMLTSAAEIRLAEAMEKFSHTRLSGERYGTVFEEVGLVSTVACENLGRGQTAAGQIVNDWINSNSHRSNLLNPDITTMCVLCEMGEEGTEFENYVYWIFLAYAP